MSAPTIAACLIVRNGAETIGRCLASVRPHVDEVCIFLAGESIDGTPEILERLAAEPGAPIRSERGGWNDDYSEARNRSFEMASADFLIWLDDDEILEGGDYLRGLLDASLPDAVYVRRVDVWQRELVQFQMRLRIVRASLGVRWKFPIHEELGSLPADARRSVADPGLVRVVHHPLRTPDRHRHRRLVEQHAGAFRHLTFMLARYLLLDDGDPERAAAAFEEVVDRREPWQPDELGMIAAAFEYLAYCRWKLGERRTAQAALDAHREVLRELRRDPFVRRCDALQKANPILPDDPLWTRYADDERTADPHEAAS